MRKAKAKSVPTRRVLESFDEFGGDKQFATTLARGLEILRCFAPEGPVLGNKDLAERTGLPKPTVSRFTYTLSRLGYLKADHISSKYQLGAAVLALAHPRSRRAITFEGRATCRNVMVASTPAARCRWGVRDRLNIVYVETSRSSSMFSRQLSDIGLSQPIAATAIGRAYIAACTPGDREAILNEIRIKTPDIYERHHKKVMHSLNEFERLGFCMSWGDLRRDVYAVGVPLRLLSTGDIVVFNCAMLALLVKPAQIRTDIGPRLAAMVRGLAAI